MPLDAFCLSAVLAELRETLVGGRIEKIYQPERDEIVLLVHTAAGSRRLLLSAAQSAARLHYTRAQKENPQSPPMFCMLLRKHIGSAAVTAVEQPPRERIAILKLACRDELGFPVEKQLILEAMGRNCNLVLVDADGRIVDCVRRIEADAASRAMLPGMFYRLPEERVAPVDMGDAAAIVRALEDCPADPLADKWIQSSFFGLSPLVARELAHRAGAGGLHRSELDAALRQRLAEQLVWLNGLVGAGGAEPNMLVLDGENRDFSFLPLTQYGGAGESVAWPDFSGLLDEFYLRRDMADRVRQRGKQLIRSVRAARDRTERKLGNQREELRQSRDREQLRRAGDLLTANLYRMERGMTSLTAVDYYDPAQGEVEIRLDPLKTPQQNAARYYRDYTRLKTAEKYLTEQIAKNEMELAYLESTLDLLSRAEGEADLRELRAELEQNGYLKGQKKDSKKRPKPPKSAGPLQYRSSAGLRIAVGRNNTQNDQLTLKTAYKSDLWLHTQKIHGSHVVLFTEGREPDAQSVREAAMLAAWHSQAQHGANVPVDYTQIRNVKKPNGARPGMVVYDPYQTVFVTPDEKLAEQLRV